MSLSTSPPTPPPSAPSLEVSLENFHRRILRNPYIPHSPHPKQALFLLYDHIGEILYGGAAGGGKTDALLMAALEYADVPGYNALVIMRTFADLALPSAGMTRAREWLSGTDAAPSDGGRSWHFPSGATLTFGYLSSVGDEQRYRTAEFQYVAFDELTRFEEQQYRFLFSRLRRLAGQAVPVRMRAGTNPGDRGHEWVKARFIPDEFFKTDRRARMQRCWEKPLEDEGEVAMFVPATRWDNPSLDQDEYGRKLRKVVSLDRARMDEGDWQAHADGRFKAEWFRRYRDMGDAWWLMPGARPSLKRGVQIITAVDPAGGVSDAACNTAIVTGAVVDTGDVLILDVVRGRIPLEHIVPTLARHCKLWRPSYVVMEDEFLQSALIRQARQTHGIPTVAAVSTGGKDKVVRATKAIIRAEYGGIYLPESAPWLDDYVSEHTSFTGDPKQDAFADQVDATAHLINAVDRFRLAAGEDAPGGRGGKGG